MVVQNIAVKSKQSLNIVTEVDLQTERLIVEYIQHAFSDHAFASEEFERSQENEGSSSQGVSGNIVA